MRILRKSEMQVFNTYLRVGSLRICNADTRWWSDSINSSDRRWQAVWCVASTANSSQRTSSACGGSAWRHTPPWMNLQVAWRLLDQVGRLQWRVEIIESSVQIIFNRRNQLWPVHRSSQTGVCVHNKCVAMATDGGKACNRFKLIYSCLDSTSTNLINFYNVKKMLLSRGNTQFFIGPLWRVRKRKIPLKYKIFKERK